MKLAHRFIRWINSSIIRRRSSSRVTPSVTASSNSTNNSDSSSAMFHNNSTSTSKQVHFADKHGEPLEHVYEIPSDKFQEPPFDESLENVYIDNGHLVTGFLKIKNLYPGRKILVKFTHDEWATHQTTTAERVEKTRRSLGRYKPFDSSCHHASTYQFRLRLNEKQTLPIKLVVISLFDGAMDNRHDKSYTIQYP